MVRLFLAVASRPVCTTDAVRLPVDAAVVGRTSYHATPDCWATADDDVPTSTAVPWLPYSTPLA